MTHPKLLRAILAPVLLAAVAFAMGLAPGGARRAHAIAAPHAPDQVVVRLRPGESIEALNADYGTTTIRELAVIAGAFLLGTPEGEDAATTIERMRPDTRLAFVEPNYLSGAPEARPRKIQVWGGSDPGPFSKQYALELLDIRAAQHFSRGEGITVAVIDTGVQLDHPALVANLLPDGYDFVDNDNDPSDTPDGLDDDEDELVDEAIGHGTHVAGIVLLVAPDAHILPIRALNADGVGDVYAVAMAIEYAVASGAHIINLSLGTDLQTDLLHDVVQAASRAGVLVVAAAGNGTFDYPQYPAADACAVAVTAVDDDARLAPDAAFGSWIGLAAPGEAIYSALIPSGYGWWSGTSMAAPFVSGQAALLRSLRPDLGLRQLTSLIVASSEEVDNAPGNLRARLIDVDDSLEYAATGRDISGRYSLVAPECTFTAAPVIPPGDPAPAATQQPVVVPAEVATVPTTTETIAPPTDTAGTDPAP